MTTIAWRIVHIAAVNYLYWDYAFGPATASFDLDIPGDAGGSHALAVRSQEIVGVLAAATFPTTVMALATGPIARSKTGEHDPLFRSQCLSTTRALPHATEMAQPADED